MSLWFYDDAPPFAFSLADELTEIKAELIRRCAADCDEPCCAEVVDLSAKREALSREAAERKARAWR